MKRMKSGGGWAAVRYTLRMANRVGWWRLWQALSAKNTCKTCALGMGGQLGGMRNEAGHWPEVCKKSLQAMVADMQHGLQAEFFQRYSVAELQTLTPRDLEWCGRLTQPVYAGPGDTHYRVVSWDDALARVSTALKSSQPDQNFFYASGRSSNEAGFILQLLARLYGTNYVNNCSFYCHQASGVGLGSTIGTGTGTVTLEDVEHADCYLLIGGNPASNHPRLMRTLMGIRRRGGQVVVINPVKEVGLINFSVPSDVRSLFFGSKIASLYVQPHIGGDLALLYGLAKVLIERDALEHRFIAEATEGFDAFAAAVTATTWQQIEQGAGVDRATIEHVADVYLRSKNVIIGWCMGITHHEHGVENVQAIVNLALLRGMLGRPGAGLMPIRGHSNVQGIGSVGVVPNLKQVVFDRLEAALGTKLPTTPGLDTMACMQAADQGTIRSALCLGGNLFGSNPDANFAAQALRKIEFVTYLNTTLNTGHAWGRGQHTLILPVRARDEETEPTTQESMFSYVRLSDGGKPRHQGPRGEVDLITSIGQQVLGDAGPVNWSSLRNHTCIRELIATIIPGYEPVADIEKTRKEFLIKGRSLHTPCFPTSNGKAKFTAHRLPTPRRGDQLCLMTVRSEGQFNTVVYEDTDIYRGQERRDVILMNLDDITRLGLVVDQKVIVRSATGAMRNILVRAYDIRAGNALMYFPEANVLVSRAVDPQSKTPAFKSVLVTVEPVSAAASTEVNGSNGRTALPLVVK